MLVALWFFQNFMLNLFEEDIKYFPMVRVLTWLCYAFSALIFEGNLLWCCNASWYGGSVNSVSSLLSCIFTLAIFCTFLIIIWCVTFPTF
jgi:hypothetical protein